MTRALKTPVAQNAHVGSKMRTHDVWRRPIRGNKRLVVDGEKLTPSAGLSAWRVLARMVVFRIPRERLAVLGGVLIVVVFLCRALGGGGAVRCVGFVHTGAHWGGSAGHSRK